jgi:trehalose 6-phosphate phosphatase
VTVEAVTPAALAAVTVAAFADAGPLLVGLDVDGVLAPIVERADQARLLPGVSDALEALTRHVTVAVVSGRSLDDLEERFALPPAVTVIGSHGLETRGANPLRLDRTEHARLHLLVEAATRARDVAGAGAWIEHKPASVVLHLREARTQRADRATRALVQDARRVPGAAVKLGHAVVEAFARSTSKAHAVTGLRDELGCRTVAFAGDDLTDEEVFASLGDHDVTVRVGSGDSAARYRLPGPPEVLAWLGAVTTDLDRR